jgi:hypothetical protein
MPLLLGAQVRVDIEGHPLDDVYAIPVASLHEGNVVHLLSRTVQVQVTPGNQEEFAPALGVQVLPSGTVLRISAPRIVSIGLGTGWAQKLGRLDVRSVQLEYRDLDTLLVRGEVPSDRELITSRIAGAVPGMWVRPKDVPRASASRNEGAAGASQGDGAEVAQ